TAALADVVLPGARFAEKDGTFSNTERRVQRVRKAIDPVGNARADWQIICDVATAMGYPMSYASPAAVFAEAASVTPSYAGISYARLEEGGIQWPCPTAEHPGTSYLHQDKFVRGLGRFTPVEYVPPAEQTDRDYPFVLNTGRRRFHYHTGTMTQRTGALEVHCATENLEINPADAGKLNIAEGDTVRVQSRRGQVEVKARLTDIVPPGLVFASFHFPAVPINKLTNPSKDPICQIPELKVCSVNVEKIS
ncbi:MAG: molybdopterin-dependent oxidoreductase, partial [Firmicutes bacterium]|nr:molybdopterin-dependent oxidoreductase [Bacillota bacterium]